MKSKGSQIKSQELYKSIITVAWKDDKFKEALISDPVKAIEKLTGLHIKLPEGKKLMAIDQTNTSIIYLNIPTEISIDDMELDEEQLEIVAGGGLIIPPFYLPQIPEDPSNDGFR